MNDAEYISLDVHQATISAAILDSAGNLVMEAIRGCGRMGISPSLFRKWLAPFRQTAFPIIGKELTDAWMLRAVRETHEFPVTGDGDAVQLAKGSYGNRSCHSSSGEERKMDSSKWTPASNE
jgi:hypothetical protein